MNKMKRNVLILLVVLLVFSLDCARSETGIVNVRLCYTASSKACTADKATFSTDIPQLYCSFSVLQNIQYEQINVAWYYMGDRRVLVKDTLIKYSDNLKMKKNIVCLERPVNGWPIGIYEVKISIKNGSSSVIKSFLMHELKE